MNSTITFPPPEPTLKLVRPTPERWAETLAEERRRLQEDHEALRAREQNLRDYEPRLRSLQAEIEAGRSIPNSPAPAAARRATPPPFLRPSSHAPFVDDPTLQAAWEKLHRAREILEAEQKNLRDDRITLHEFEKQVKQREDALAERETRIAEREALLTAAAAPEAKAAAAEQSASTVSKITRAPFNMARSEFLMRAVRQRRPTANIQFCSKLWTATATRWAKFISTLS